MTRAQLPSRTRTASADVTDSLLQSALALLGEGGTEAITVRAVAAHAGVAPMGVYSRFGGKDGLLEALFVWGFDALHQAISAARGPDALSRLRRGCGAYRDFALGHPHLYQLMFQQMLELELSDEALERAAATFGELVSRVADAMESGQLASTDDVEVAQQIWSAMHGSASLELAGIGFTGDAEQTFEGMLDALVRGLASS
jgi:AcrR family transcriptional regulator